MMSTDYNDDYPTCHRTYAGLRIYYDDLDPDRITGLLGIEPSQTQVKGQVTTGKIPPPIGGWFLSTKDVTTSKDVRRHVDWILNRLEGKDDVLKGLQAAGYRMDIFCFWDSANGHGGPTLSPSIMKRLGQLEIEIGFDIYGGSSDE